MNEGTSSMLDFINLEWYGPISGKIRLPFILCTEAKAARLLFLLKKSDCQPDKLSIWGESERNFTDEEFVSPS